MIYITNVEETILFRRAWAARLFDEHVSTYNDGCRMRIKGGLKQWRC